MWDKCFESSVEIGVEIGENGHAGQEQDRRHADLEDSPLFNFINSLSPIQPVKSVQSIQTFQSQSFAAISSVFSSPQVSLQKESRFLIRPSFPDSIKQGSSDSFDESIVYPGVSNGATPSTCKALVQENSNITCSVNEATIDTPDGNSHQRDLSHVMQFDNGSPNHSTTPCYGIKLDFKLDFSCTPELVQFIQYGTENISNKLSNEIGLKMKVQEGQKDCASEYYLENLISVDADDLLNVDPTEAETSKMEERDSSISLNTQTAASLGLCPQNESHVSVVDCDGEADEQPGMGRSPKLLSGTCHNQVVACKQNQKTDSGGKSHVSSGCKVDSQQLRGIRRRCLTFDVSGVSKRNLYNKSNVPTSTTLPIKGKSSSDDQLLVSSKTPSTPPCILPGIGLHLNALASSSKDKTIPLENKVPGREIISKPCSLRPPPAEVGEKDASKSLNLGQNPDPIGSVDLNHKVSNFVVSQTPAPCIEESTSPRKRRRKVENGVGNEGCKRCKCKKSKCLKLYCECFAAGVYCVEPCSCQGCFNKPIHEETVLATRKQIESRNPLAFAPKVIRPPEHDQDMGEDSNKTPGSSRHKNGCNCKKSNCLKKYCECYQGGVGCSFSCRCDSCKNAFGRKDGPDEIECGREIVNGGKERLQSNEGQENANVPKPEHGHVSEGALPLSPFPICRSLVKFPFLPGGKPSRSSILSQMSKKSENQLVQCNNEKCVENFQDDDTPEILRGNSSPSSTLKTASPNGKRISPPHNGLGISPNRKGGRRLILKSIPSFPSLNGEAPFESSTTGTNN
ncbi:Protein tesmin/TSO1-like CXC 2 [Apostasia shenzhenica]|uniref:Protein tesmin/TSO1-like CXC 2 n=1 Tax=Apostasia shenzhenica TaxID=1088818 RepID=A0A2I0BE65_9ASPA|nr:Protein tesmin/TSO1-like CXC 2 [Apostasia shenzhenica]